MSTMPPRDRQQGQSPQRKKGELSWTRVAEDDIHAMSFVDGDGILIGAGLARLSQDSPHTQHDVEHNWHRLSCRRVLQEARTRQSAELTLSPGPRASFIACHTVPTTRGGSQPFPSTWSHPSALHALGVARLLSGIMRERVLMSGLMFHPHSQGPTERGVHQHVRRGTSTASTAHRGCRAGTSHWEWQGPSCGGRGVAANVMGVEGIRGGGLSHPGLLATTGSMPSCRGQKPEATGETSD